MISLHPRWCLVVGAFLVAMGALRPVPAAAAPLASPVVSIALRGLVDDAIEQGEPLRVMVALEAEPGAAAIELLPASGTWADALRVELLATGDRPVLARADPVGTPAAPQARLDGERIAGGLWVFPSGVLQTPGEYTVRARLLLAGEAGWTGEASSEEVPFRVIALSSSPERVRARALSRAHLAFARNAFEEAAGLIDAELAKAPDDFDLLCMRAEVSLAVGNTAGASLCVLRATRLLPRRAGGPPPPVLHDLQRRLLMAQLQPAAAPATVPDWSWPPDSVMTVLAKDAIDAFPKKPAGTVGGLPASTAGAAATSLPSAASPAPLPPKPTVTPAPSPVAPPRLSPVPAHASAAPTEAGPPRPGIQNLGTVVPSRELTDTGVAADPAGQWAVEATAGSQYGKAQYSARQATGAPNVRVAGNSPDAWCPAVQSKGMDWLELTFAKPVRATEVRARQNDACGAIVKVEAFDPDGGAHVWWEGVDPHQAGPVRQIVWFAVRVPPTSYLVSRIKLTLNLASGPGYKEIDAVQLVGVLP